MGQEMSQCWAHSQDDAPLPCQGLVEVISCCPGTEEHFILYSKYSSRELLLEFHSQMFMERSKRKGLERGKKSPFSPLPHIPQTSKKTQLPRTTLMWPPQEFLGTTHLDEAGALYNSPCLYFHHVLICRWHEPTFCAVFSMETLYSI